MSSKTLPVASLANVTLICSISPTFELVTLISIGTGFLDTLNSAVAFDPR